MDTTKSHKIVFKSACRLGRVQVEDWTPVYPGLHKPYTVGLYAKLAETPEYGGNIALRRGESTRLEFHFETLDEAREAYEAMRDGGDPHDWISAFLPSNHRWTDEDTRVCIPH